MRGRATNRRIVVALVLATAVSASAQEIAVREGEESPRAKLLMVPYAFYNDTIGLSVGATAGTQGFPQKHSSLWACVSFPFATLRSGPRDPVFAPVLQNRY